MLSRRSFLGALALGGSLGAAACGTGSSSSRPSRKTGAVTPKTIRYGSDASQFGELSKPEGEAHDATVVIIHGGFWRAQYGLELGRPLAEDLSRRGYRVWNLEYRRVGLGGGWPGTLEDVAAGIDHLAELGPTTRIVVIGHSAGGHLAVWAAGRRGQPAGAPGADPALMPVAAVAQAGVLDLATAARTGVGGTAVTDLLGGTPDAVPARYRVADPIAQVPLPVPVLCVHARADANVPYAQSTAYVQAATAAGAKAVLKTVPGDHFTLIDPATPAWATVRDALPGLLAGRLPD